MVSENVVCFHFMLTLLIDKYILKKAWHQKIKKNDQEILQMLENIIDNDKLQAFKSCQGEWSRDIKDTSLFYLWNKFQRSDEEEEMVLDNCELLDDNNGSISIDVDNSEVFNVKIIR